MRGTAQYESLSFCITAAPLLAQRVVRSPSPHRACTRIRKRGPRSFSARLRRWNDYISLGVDRITHTGNKVGEFTSSLLREVPEAVETENIHKVTDLVFRSW